MDGIFDLFGLIFHFFRLLGKGLVFTGLWISIIFSVILILTIDIFARVLNLSYGWFGVLSSDDFTLIIVIALLVSLIPAIIITSIRIIRRVKGYPDLRLRDLAKSKGKNE